VSAPPHEHDCPQGVSEPLSQAPRTQRKPHAEEPEVESPVKLAGRVVRQDNAGPAFPAPLKACAHWGGPNVLDLQIGHSFGRKSQMGR